MKCDQRLIIVRQACEASLFLADRRRAHQKAGREQGKNKARQEQDQDQEQSKSRVVFRQGSYSQHVASTSHQWFILDLNTVSIPYLDSESNGDPSEFLVPANRAGLEAHRHKCEGSNDLFCQVRTLLSRLPIGPLTG